MFSCDLLCFVPYSSAVMEVYSAGFYWLIAQLENKKAKPL